MSRRKDPVSGFELGCARVTPLFFTLLGMNADSDVFAVLVVGGVVLPRYI